MKLKNKYILAQFNLKVLSSLILQLHYAKISDITEVKIYKGESNFEK